MVEWDNSGYEIKYYVDSLNCNRLNIRESTIYVNGGSPKSVSFSKVSPVEKIGYPKEYKHTQKWIERKENKNIIFYVFMTLYVVGLSLIWWWRNRQSNFVRVGVWVFLCIIAYLFSAIDSLYYSIFLFHVAGLFFLGITKYFAWSSYLSASIYGICAGFLLFLDREYNQEYFYQSISWTSVILVNVFSVFFYANLKDNYFYGLLNSEHTIRNYVESTHHSVATFQDYRDQIDNSSSQSAILAVLVPEIITYLMFASGVVRFAY